MKVGKEYIFQCSFGKKIYPISHFEIYNPQFYENAKIILNFFSFTILKNSELFIFDYFWNRKKSFR